MGLPDLGIDVVAQAGVVRHAAQGVVDEALAFVRIRHVGRGLEPVAVVVAVLPVLPACADDEREIVVVAVVEVWICGSGARS
jgi:hypothetical protein